MDSSTTQPAFIKPPQPTAIPVEGAFNSMAHQARKFEEAVRILREAGYSARASWHEGKQKALLSCDFSISGRTFLVSELFSDKTTPEDAASFILDVISRKKASTKKA